MIKKESDPDIKQLRLELMEDHAQLSEIDSFYVDTVCVSEDGYVPYGWQFAGEKVSIKTTLKEDKK